jgi:protein-S-isoprenylcysteine O-methyltransferase Ste14
VSGFVRRRIGFDQPSRGVLLTMNVWFAKTVIVLAYLAMLALRAPHIRRSRATPVRKSRKGPLELFLLSIAGLAFGLLLTWIVTPVFAFADYPLHLIPLLSGACGLGLGLGLLYRAHADLATSWSVTLEVRAKHEVVTHGVYRWVRHPIYLALLIYSVGQALVVPNWLVGPSGGVAVALLVAFRLGQPASRFLTPW